MDKHLTRAAAQTLRDRRILVVEDEFHIADEIARALSAAGAKVCGPVATLADARRETGEDRDVEAAILDVRLADEDTFEIADRLRERHVPFVFATGYDDVVIPDRHRDIPHFGKPFDIDRLLRVLADSFP